MNESIDILIFKFRQKLTETTNACTLPLSVKSMIVKELYEAVSVAASKSLQNQLNNSEQVETNESESN